MKHAKLFLLGAGAITLLGGCDLGSGKPERRRRSRHLSV
jgi:hypothetical protein